jgi:hypothetical protein
MRYLRTALQTAKNLPFLCKQKRGSRGFAKRVGNEREGIDGLRGARGPFNCSFMPGLAESPYQLQWWGPHLRAKCP